MFEHLLTHRVLTSITFWLVIVLGAYAFLTLPREQDPSINFNWVQIMTGWPGASAADVEKRITDRLEDGIAKVPDIKFISSSSREGVSSILVRFNELQADDFSRRVSDLHREVQNREEELPDNLIGPNLLEITSANAFPTATLLLVGLADDASIRRFARVAEEELERWPEIERVDAFGNRDPEIQVQFSMEKLAGLGVNPADVAETIKSYFKDLAAGSIGLGDQQWLVRLIGTSADPDFIGRLPLITSKGEVPLRAVAEVSTGAKDPDHLVRFDGRPAIMLSIYKEDKANNLKLLEKIRKYIVERNEVNKTTGIKLVLVDDQTVTTREALTIMQNNALIGLLLVMLVTWLFLGSKIALHTTIGIPFVLAGTLLFLSLTGQTLNVTVLLAIVISLGMLVDDAVVVVEGIYYHLARGMAAMEAAVKALNEAIAPVTTAVMTTIAAFLPLLLLPGLLGDFMRVVPIVVTVALLVSLIEAYWMLPAHVVSSRIPFQRDSGSQRLRERVNRAIRRLYTQTLARTMRNPKQSLMAVAAIGALAVTLLATGAIRMDFFASDFFRLFYVNITMPPGTSLEKTSDTLQKIEKVINEHLFANEKRATTTYSGLGYTEKEPVLGDEYGQVFVTLQPASEDKRRIDEIIDSMRAAVEGVPGPVSVSFDRRKTGPPTAKPINVKVRGDSLARIREATDLLIVELERVPGVIDVSDDDVLGKTQLSVRLNPDAVTRAGLKPADVIRMIRLFADGEVVAEMQHEGEEVDVRVRADPKIYQDIDQFLSNSIALPNGGEIALSELLFFETHQARDNIRHHNLRRSITIEGDIDSTLIDTIEANQYVEEAWQRHASQFPDIDLDLSGELDDIKEGMQSLIVLFAVGLALIYLILGTQFKSYGQPLLVLVAVPLAFIGVVMGLFVTRNPMSLYTLYGVIALAGIAANDAIVLISTANRNIRNGIGRVHAIVLAARRRVIPILITSLTTMAGLFSLATGLAGESLLWGPVATSIVWGLAFSTILTLFVVPLLYQSLGNTARLVEAHLPMPPALGDFANTSPITRIPLVLLRWQKGQFRRNLRDRDDIQSIIANPTYKELYEKGFDAMCKKDFDAAINNFQALADAVPNNALVNRFAAQSHVAFMQRDGWDVGYFVRAKRYLSRASKADTKNRHIRQLEEAIAALGDDMAKQESGTAS